MLFRPVQTSNAVPGLLLVVTGQRYVHDGSRLSPDPRDLDRLITRTCFQAACHATNLSTGYALEKAYGPDGAGTDCWPDRRKYVWDGMGKHGSPAIRTAIARRDPAVLARLEAVRTKSNLVDFVLSWSAWRHMDLRGLAAEQLAEPPDDMFGFERPTLERPLPVPLGPWVKMMRGALGAAESRYRAMNAIWYFLRRAIVDCDLLLYIVSFLVWRDALSRFRTDPLLGPIVDDLEAYTCQNFAVLHAHTRPADADHCGMLTPLGQDLIDLKTPSEITFRQELLDRLISERRPNLFPLVDIVEAPLLIPQPLSRSSNSRG